MGSVVSNTIKFGKPQIRFLWNKTNMATKTILLFSILTYVTLDPALGLSGSRPWVFPFKYKGDKYNSCTTAGDPDGRFWCAVNVKPGREMRNSGKWPGVTRQIQILDLGNAKYLSNIKVLNTPNVPQRIIQHHGVVLKKKSVLGEIVSSETEVHNALAIKFLQLVIGGEGVKEQKMGKLLWNTKYKVFMIFTSATIYKIAEVY